MSKATWRCVRYGHYQYYDATGKILGEVHRGRDCWYASIGSMPTGRYISEEQAKEAVEREAEGSGNVR